MHLSKVISFCRIYLSSVYSLLKGILSQRGSTQRKIGQEARDDLSVWEKFLDIPPNRNFRILCKSDPPNFIIATDSAASNGFGCVFGSKWFSGEWPNQEWRLFHIAFLELYPIYMALHAWCEVFEENSVRILTDNISLVPVINNLYSKDAKLRQLVKPIAILCLTKNIFLSACHTPGIHNIGPDLLSRGRVNEFLTRFPSANRIPQEIPAYLFPANFKLLKKN